MSRISAGEKLHKEMQLSLEPVRMVNMKRLAAAFDQKILSTPPAAAGVPATLQILELSNLDQLFDYYNSVALFYDVHHYGRRDTRGSDHDRIGAAADVVDAPVKKLRSALEELLVHQPAAAGRLCHCVNDSDEPGRLQIEYYSSPHESCQYDGDNLLYGVPFVVAHADAALSELGDVSHPHPSLDILYPKMTVQDSNGQYLPRPVMVMQVTTFTCGSFCLAHMCSHAYMDGHAGATFLQNMCSIARGGGLTVLPNDLISRREIMKPRMPPSPSPMVDNTSFRTRKQGEEKQPLPYSTATRFAFSTAALEALRRKASSSAGQAKISKPCSRHQALAALLWIARAKSVMASSDGHLPANQELNLRITMNLRGKGIPGLDRGYVGNAIFLFTVRATLQELCESSLQSVVCKIKSVLETGMDNLLECAQSRIDYIELQLRAGLVPYVDNSDSGLGLPSLVNLPFYDTDCGWGQPIYCARPSKQLGGRLIILDHPAAGAWNVLAVFNSQEEHAAFKEEIAEYIKS